MNTAEFKSATFPNAGPRHLLDDSVMEPHAPLRGQAESSTLSSGISIGEILSQSVKVSFEIQICIFFSLYLYATPPPYYLNIMHRPYPHSIHRVMGEDKLVHTANRVSNLMIF